MRNRKHVRILKHHRNSSVYVDGRYLHVDTKISVRSKRGREIARETAEAILAEVGASEGAFEILQDNLERVAKGEAPIKPEGAHVPFDIPVAKPNTIRDITAAGSDDGTQ